jgi:hypothetical protein
MPPFVLTDVARKVLCQIYDAGGGGVLSTTGSNARVLIAGEYIHTSADTLLRLLVFGMLETDGKGRLKLTALGRENVALPPNVLVFERKGDA